MTIFVRDLTNEEGNRLLWIARKGANPVEVVVPFLFWLQRKR